MGNEGNIFNSFIRTILTTISDTIDTISDSVGARTDASAAPTATDHIFNAGTQIVASAKSESGGNSIQIWIEIQEI